MTGPSALGLHAHGPPAMVLDDCGADEKSQQQPPWMVLKSHFSSD
jgi:hypothetical protein